MRAGKLPFGPGQTCHRQIEQRQIGRQLFRRVTLGIDGHEYCLQAGCVDARSATSSSDVDSSVNVIGQTSGQ